MLTQERLKEVLCYTPDTGLFIWLISHKRIHAGMIAGSIDSDGYVIIMIDNHSYRAGRLAFLYMIGEWPKGEADHEDGIKNNDRWNNLRDLTHQQNSAHRPIPNRNKGVSRWWQCKEIT